MPIRIAPPTGLSFKPPGSGYVFGDGFQMWPNASGEWWLPDTHAHMLTMLLGQGWKRWEAPPAPRIYRNDLERMAIEHPLDTAEILKQCEREGAKLRVEANRLQAKGGISPLLREHLALHRIELRNELERTRNVRWEDV